MSDATKLATAAANRDPATGLRAVAALRKLLEQLERAQVMSARGQGWSWQDIADALGVSRQAVHKKHASSTTSGRRGLLAGRRED
jgi:DNA-directed RNA polymerase specialized sigma24 family protein